MEFEPIRQVVHALSELAQDHGVKALGSACPTASSHFAEEALKIAAMQEGKRGDDLNAALVATLAGPAA